MSRLSTRVSIKWDKEPASEPTDTLVMGIGDHYMDLRVRKADTTIDWAMSGQRLIRSEDPLSIEFTHLVDSRGYTEPDLGVFTKLPDGDDLEKGSMPWPERDNVITPYEEVWHEFPAPKSGSVSWIVWNEKDGPDGKELTFLGHLAPSYLAFKKVGEKQFTAVREDKDAQGTWQPIYRIGEAELPRMQDVVSSKPDEWLGQKTVDVGGVEYHVLEAVQEP